MIDGTRPPGNHLTWRERVKSGSFNGLYTLLRNGKRRALRQPLNGYVSNTPTHLTVDALLRLAPRMRDHARLPFSLGLAYLERGRPGDDEKAVHCFRDAAALGFESPERVALHLARLSARRGEADESAQLVEGLDAGELTDAERALLQQLSSTSRASVMLPAEPAATHIRRRRRVSVVVPNYNYGRFLKERIRSILRQTMSDLELLYVDDGSTDQSNRFASLFASDPRVRLRFCERNSGTVYQRWNEAAQEATGEWLWFANADDSAHPRFLERLLAMTVDRPSVAIVHSNVALIDDSGRLLSAGLGGSQEVIARLQSDGVVAGSNEVVSVTGGLYLRTASAMILRRDAFLHAGGFDVRLWGAADYDLYLRMLHHHDLAFAAEPLAYYREHGSNTTRLTDPVRHSVALAYAFACAYARSVGDRRYTPEMREAMLRRLRAHVFDIFVDPSRTVPDGWRFAADQIYEVLPDPRLLARVDS